MRCPYCGGFNPDTATFCRHCGRDLKPVTYQPPTRQQPPYSQPRQVPPSQGRPVPAVPQTPAQQSVRTRARQPDVPIVPPPPPAPEPPAPFPPRTMEQLRALEQGALPYTVVGSAIGDGRKKIVRIAYAKSIPWQQVATLLKAFKEQQEEKFDTVIIQGFLDSDTAAYSFTNGQLYFDRNVRLGSQTTNRYQIETGNGFESDSVRIVLTE